MCQILKLLKLWFYVLVLKSLQGLSYPNLPISYYDAFFSWMDVVNWFQKVLHMVVESPTKEM
jgi:hypothetical protein